MTVDTAAPYVYAILEESGGAFVGHLDANCKALKGERRFVPRRLQPDPEVDPWPCSRCVGVEQLAAWDPDWPPRFPPEEIQEILPAELKVLHPAAENSSVPSYTTGNLEDTTMNATTNRSNDLTAEILEGLKNAFATAARYGVPGVEDMRQATLKCYRLGDLTAQAALDLTDTYVAAAQVKAQVAADTKPEWWEQLDRPAAADLHTPKQAGQPVVCENKAPAQPFKPGQIVLGRDGRPVKVCQSKSTGNLYGKVKDEWGTWEYVGGSLKGARHFTPEEAKAWADLNGHYCVFCQTALEDKRSTDMGYGPVCAKRYGLPWG